MRWRRPRLANAAHLALALLVALVVTFAGAVVISALVADDLAAFVLGMLWGTVVGCAVTIYDAEVISR